jgi:N-acetyl-gamma-glutamyl-phosphate reductase
MIRAAVVGATGYAGAELVRILAGHDSVDLTVLTSRQYDGRPFGEVYPAMAGRVDTVCETYEADRVGERADVAFLALPHKLPMAFVPALLDRQVRVVDLSADFRFNDADLYESVYQPHTARALLGKTVYGLSEIYGADIAAADLIGNPGCYPTSVLLPLVPLIREGLIKIDHLIADAKSGVSGAGRSVALATHFCEIHEAFKPYKVAEHRHNPEMDMILAREAGTAVHLTFVPHLVPMSRGMQTTLYADAADAADSRRIHQCLADSYADAPFVRVLAPGGIPTTRSVRGTNCCDIGVRVDAACGRVILMSAIDNLVKGAAGQAVQNMNLMFGLDQTAGLSTMPYPL